MKSVKSKAVFLVLVIGLVLASGGIVQASDVQNKLVSKLYQNNGGRISCDFDGYTTTSGRHEGIDFTNYSGATIYSLTSGTVIRANNPSSGLSTLSIYDSTNNKSVIYLHATGYKVSVGQSVNQGQAIAVEGSKGSTAAHTHIEVRNGKQGYASVSVGDSVLDNENPYPYWEKIFVVSNPPSNPQISMNKGWYDLSDTIEVTAHADNATDYWISMYKDGQQIVNGERAENGKFTIPASQHGIGLYSCYFSCSNSAGSVDTAWINNLSVVGSPSYTDIWTSKEIYDLDEKVIINVLPICARGQIVGIDKVGPGRVVTEDCGESYQIQASQLGEGTYWTYFALYNGSGVIGTKYVTFKITNRCNLGDSFYAKIKNSTSNQYITNVQGNVEGTEESCGRSQIWHFQRQSDGSYKIISTLDQNAIDAKDYGNAGGGTNLQMNTSWDTTAQKFKIYEAYDALYFEPVCCDMFMDLTGSGNVELWGGGGNYASQKFEIEKVDSATSEHKYVSEITKQPTCTKEGIETHTCSFCGDSYTSKIEKIPHSYSTEWTTDTLPTTTMEGSKSHHCTECGAKTDITAIPKLDIIPQGGVFSIVDASGKVDEVVNVYINVENNPGIVGATLGVTYDTDKLQLISCEDQGVLNDYQWSELDHQPFLMNWEDPLATVNNTANGNITKLQFKILKDLGEDGAELKLTIDTVYDVNIEDVLFTAKSGKITMSKYKPGDMNDDGVINSKDSILLRKYVLGGSGVINKDAADVNRDGAVNSKDSIILRKYVLGGNVELK